MAENIDIKVLIDDSKASKSLQDLQSNLKKLEKAAESIGKGGEGFDDLQKAIDETKKSMLEEAIAASKSAKSMGELRKAMAQLKSVQEDVDKTSPDFDRLIDSINETEGKVGDLNDQFRTFAGSGIERAKASTGLLREGFDNLDLEKVSIGFGGLSKTISGFAGNINKTNPFVVGFGKSFKNLGAGMKGFSETGIGSVVKALGSLGKAILTNPILLLAAVIAGLVVAFVQFYDKIKPVKAYIDLIGKAIGFVVQKLKDLGDALGLTAFAAEESAKRQQEAAKKTQKSVEQRYDREIAIAGAAGKATEGLELQKIALVRNSVKEQIKAIYALQVANGELTDEQKTNLQELSDQLYGLETDYKVVLAKITKNTKDQLDDEKKANDEAAAKRKEEAKKRWEEKKKQAEEEAKQREADNAKALKQLEDLNAEAIKDDENREKEKLRLSTERSLQEIENTKADEATKSALRMALIEEEQRGITEITEKYRKEREDKEKAAIEKKFKDDLDRRNAFNALTLEGEELELANLQSNLEEQLRLYTDDQDMRLAILADFAQKGQDIKDKYAEEERQKKQKALDDDVAIATSAFDAIGSLSSALFDVKRNNLEKGSEAELAAAKKQFKINKALQLSSAVIVGIQSVMAAFRNGMNNPVPLLGPATAAIYAAIAGVSAAANIAKIASTKFEGGSFSPTTGGGGGAAPGGGGGTTQAAGGFTPGMFYSLGTKTGSGANMDNTRSQVYVGDINRVQNKVEVLENRATLGQ